MLVDTSVWIDFFNGHASTEADRLTRAIADGEQIRIAGLVLTEILLGLRSDSQARRIESLLDAFDYLPDSDRSDHVAAASLYRLCRARGRTIQSVVDCLIAQLCLRHGVPLLTKDRDFRAIAACVPLQLLET